MLLTRLPLALLALGALACSGDDDDATRPTDPTAVATGDTTDTGTVAVEAPFAALPRAEVPDGVGGAREVFVEATEPCTLDLVWADGERRSSWPEATSFQVPLVGLSPGSATTLTLTLTPTGGGEAASRTLELVGDPLPANLPDLDVLTLDAVRVSPGHTLFATSAPSLTGAWLLLLDPSGTPVWWRYEEVRLGDLRLTDDGTLLGLGEWEILELDWLGRPLRHFATHGGPSAGTAIDARFVHHDVVPLPGGGLLTLDQVARPVDDLPADYEDLDTLGPGIVADDRVVELGPDGSVIRSVSLADRLPTSRISWDSLLPVAPLDGAVDWAHANAVAIDDDGGWVISSRHQDAVFKLDAAGELLWILGDPAGWPSPYDTLLLDAEGPLTWPYHQHAPELRRDADGLHVLLFDNVNTGHTPYTPFTGERPSRLVEFVVDEAAGTVTEAWSFEMDQDGPLAAVALGDADRLDNGNVLGVWGLLSQEGGLPNAQQGRANLSARLAEVDPATNDVVFDLRVGWPRSRGTEGWTVYRAERLPTLHPTPSR